MDILVYTGVVLTITQILKKALRIESKFVPLVALLIGGLFFLTAYILGAVTLDYTSIMNAFVGILSAMGIYSGYSATLK